MPPRVLLTRPLPSAGQTLLNDAHEHGRILLVKHDNESAAPRDWIMNHLAQGDIVGILCMLGDKVNGGREQATRGFPWKFTDSMAHSCPLVLLTD